MGFNNLRIVLIIKGCYKVKSIRPKSFFFWDVFYLFKNPNTLKSCISWDSKMLRYILASTLVIWTLSILMPIKRNNSRLSVHFCFWILRICPKQYVPRFCNQAFSGFQWILLERSLPKISCFWTSDLKQWQLSRSIHKV